MSNGEQSFENLRGGLIYEDSETQQKLLRKPIQLTNETALYADPSDSVSERSTHETYYVDGFGINVYETTPRVPVDNPPHALILPGFIEHTGHGVGRKFQHTLARYAPHVYFHGIATDGYGPGADRYTHSQRHQHDLVAMGDTRLRLIDDVVPSESPLFFVSTSMSSIITKELINRMDERRLQQVTGIVLNAVALVEEGGEGDKYSHLKKFGRFLFSVVPDVGVEIATTPPNRLWGLFMDLVDSGHFSKDDVYPLAHLGLDILSGSDPNDIESMLRRLEHTNVSVLTGDKDPVGELKMWNRLVEEFENLKLFPVKGRSHGIVINPVRNGRAISKILYDTDVIEVVENTPV